MKSKYILLTGLSVLFLLIAFAVQAFDLMELAKKAADGAIKKKYCMAAFVKKDPEVGDAFIGCRMQKGYLGLTFDLAPDGTDCSCKIGDKTMSGTIQSFDMSSFE